MKIEFGKSLWLIVLVMFYLQPGVRADDEIDCEELAPDEAFPCDPGMVSWEEQAPGESQVCSGAWEYHVDSSCMRSHPACGAGSCLYPKSCQRWSFGATNKSYSPTQTFQIPDRYVCERDHRGLYRCHSIPNPEQARSACSERLAALKQDKSSSYSYVRSSYFTGPTLVSRNPDAHSSTFRCSFSINYRVANRKYNAEVCGCYNMVYPVCELHGPEYCPPEVHFSEHGLTEEDFTEMYAYDPNAHHICTTCEDIADERMRFNCLYSRIESMIDADIENQELFDQLMHQLKLTVEMGGLLLTYDPRPNEPSVRNAQIRKVYQWYLEYPTEFSCGHSSESVGSCGSFETLDSMLEFCARLMSQHTEENGVLTEYSFNVCYLYLGDELIDVIKPTTIAWRSFTYCQGEDWRPYVDEFLQIAAVVGQCREHDSGPTGEMPCHECTLESLLK